MNAREFHSALRIMWNLDRHDLVNAGVLDADDYGGWKAFRDYPHNQAIRLSDERFDRFFELIEGRQPKTLETRMLQTKTLKPDSRLSLTFA